MKAFVYEEHKKLVLKEIPRPQIEKDSAIIKVNACSICGTDLRTYLHGSNRISPPRVIGHEVVGTIIEMGKNVTGFKSGDRVAVAPAVGCGKCYYCKNGFTNICDNLETIGFQYDGGFAEYMEIPTRAFAVGNVNKLSSLIDDVEAAVAEPIACCVNAQEFLDIQEGNSVVIFGAGFIGCIHAELALSKGAAKVIIVEMAEERAKQAAELIDELIVINPLIDSFKERITDITEGRGADVVITACSSGKAQESAISIAAKRGRISLFGGLPGDSMGFIDSNEIHYKELGVFGVHASTSLQNKKVLDWISNGRLNVKKYINTYSLTNIVEAFEAVREGNVFKAVIRP